MAARPSTSPTSSARSRPSCRRCAASSSCSRWARKAVVRDSSTSLIHSGRRAQTWGDAVSARKAPPLRFTAPPLRPPALRAFFVRHYRHAQVHRALGRRHAAQAPCEHALHTDVKDGDRLFYFTTLGWMMWNWLVSGLAQGATLLLYDGSPFHPTGNILWDYAQAEKLHALRHVRQVHRCAEGGAGAGPEP